MMTFSESQANPEKPIPGIGGWQGFLIQALVAVAVTLLLLPFIAVWVIAERQRWCHVKPSEVCEP